MMKQITGKLRGIRWANIIQLSNSVHGWIMPLKEVDVRRLINVSRKFSRACVIDYVIATGSFIVV